MLNGLKRRMPVRILKAENANDGSKRKEARCVPNCRADKQQRRRKPFLAEQISRFCAEHCLFPKMDCYRDQESCF